MQQLPGRLEIGKKSDQSLDSPEISLGSNDCLFELQNFSKFNVVEVFELESNFVQVVNLHHRARPLRLALAKSVADAYDAQRIWT